MRGDTGHLGGQMSGVYRFSSIVKQNKKAKNYAVFCYAGFFLNFFYVMK
jgi:hypothetical protein